MSRSEQKVVQYLNEAHCAEVALVRVLQTQIAMTPQGGYRTALEKHLDQTRDHSDRVQTRLGELSQSGNPLKLVGTVVDKVAGQAFALAKAPVALVRGSGGEEKVLKNAKDACASEALEIATYTALERLASSVADDRTAELAASLRADEEKMLERILREIPKLTEAVVGAEVKGSPTYDVTKTGAADFVRATGRAAVESAHATSDATKRTARQARKVPGVAQAEGQVKGVVASQSDLAIARYDTLSAAEITAKLSGLSQIDLAKIDSYERRHKNRATVLSHIGTLRGDEPWPGYDELTAAEVQAALAKADAKRASEVHAYERTHKGRAGVLKAAERTSSSTTDDHDDKEPHMSLADDVRKIPGLAAVEGAVKGALADEQDLPIAGYDKLSAGDVVAKLNGFSQRELRMIDAYERQHQDRSTITDKIGKLTGDEPWSGYDEQTVDTITTALSGVGAKEAQTVKSYERTHKARAGVLEAADKTTTRD